MIGLPRWRRRDRPRPVLNRWRSTAGWGIGVEWGVPGSDPVWSVGIERRRASTAVDVCDGCLADFPVSVLHRDAVVHDETTSGQVAGTAVCADYCPDCWAVKNGAH